MTDSQVGSAFEDYVLTEGESSFGNVYITPIVTEALEDKTLIGEKAMEDTTQIGDETTEDTALIRDKTTENTALIGYNDTEDANLVGEKVTDKATLILTFSENVAEAEYVTHTVDTDLKAVGTESLTTRTETTESLNPETSRFIKTESTVTLHLEVQQTNRSKRRNELDALNDDSNSQGILNYTDKNDKQLDVTNTVAETDEKRIVLRQENQMRENWTPRFQGPWVPRKWTNDIKTSRVVSVLPVQSNKTELETFGLLTKAERLPKNSIEAERFPEDKREAERFSEDKREAETPLKNRTEAERFELPKNRTEADTLPQKKLETENLKYSESEKLSKGQWEEGWVNRVDNSDKWSEIYPHL
ncbi:hypothetical protein TNCV_3926931 [Trichonephila clavipes]|nr:hypothetical protein TNCV_3926931 [Trichonephila clavipes]